jgi:hypothetical protein
MRVSPILSSENKNLMRKLGIGRYETASLDVDPALGYCDVSGQFCQHYAST